MIETRSGSSFGGGAAGVRFMGESAAPGRPGLLTGYAAVFNRWSHPLGGGSRQFREIIRTGAFDRSLRQLAANPVRMRVNHQGGLLVVGCTRRNLRLSVDSTGLRFTCDLPDTSAGRDIAELVRKGIFGECSFGFVVREGGDRWDYEGGEARRELLDVFLLEISAVVDGAYGDTTVSVA